MHHWQQKTLKTNGITMHYVEESTAEGSGLPVIMLHGFPHIWFSWHHQIRAVSKAGFRVIAPDLRGMGGTDAPAEPEAYSVKEITADLIGLLDALDIEKAVFVGLDFGAFAAYDLAMLHSDRVIAVIGLENPAAPHNPDMPPLQEYAEMAKNHFVHIEYFREPGIADAALNNAPREFLSKVFYALSADYHYLDVWKHPPGTTYLDALPEAPPLPWAWLSEDEMDVFVEYYERSGFTGGLNYYRSMDIKWQERKPLEGKVSEVPAYFIGSEQDCDLEGFHGPDPISLMRSQFPNLKRVEMIKNAGHLVQLEKPEEVNALLIDYLKRIELDLKQDSENKIGDSKILKGDAQLHKP